MSNTQKAVPAEVKPVEEAPPVSAEVEALLELEQLNLDKATQKAQLAYLSNRVAELTQENYDLKQKEDK